MSQGLPQLHLDLSTHVFLDTSSQVVYLREATRAECAMRAGLQPLLYYGLWDPSRPRFSWYVFPALMSEPVTPHELLSDFWLVEPKPSRILVGRRYEAIFPGSIDAIRRLCEVEVAATSNRSYNIHQRWLREQDWQLTYRALRERNVDANGNVGLDALTALRRQGLEWFNAERPPSDDVLRRSIPCPTVMHGYVISPGGFSHQASLPPRSVQAIEADQRDATERANEPAEDAGLDTVELAVESPNVSPYDGFTDGFELANVISNFWPGGLARVSREAGVRRNDLVWFLQGKQGLDRYQHSDLMATLGLSYNEMWGEFEPTMGLCANVTRQSISSFVKLYDAFSNGGDCQFSFEPVPNAPESPRGRADPSFRFLVMRAYGGPLLLAGFQRGSAIASRVLDADTCINFTGTNPLSPERYQRIVDTFAKINAQPAQMWKLLEACEKDLGVQGSWGPV